MKQRAEFDGNYYEPRRCLREPVPEIFHAAELISRAASAFCAEDHVSARKLIRDANFPAIRDWAESLWGRKDKYPEKPHYLRLRSVQDSAEIPSVREKAGSRQPSADVAKQVLSKYGWNCTYCGIPLFSRTARDILRAAYVDDLPWGASNSEKHAAFMAMDNEFDHVVPHSKGGTNEAENLVSCCAPCNCAKEAYTLDELGLIDPRLRFSQKTTWDGLTRLTD